METLYNHLELRPSDLEGLVREIAYNVQRELRLTHSGLRAPYADLFASPAAASLKDDIVSTGRKLWARNYVDGCGGNISARLGSDYILCTPSMLSKADVTVDDLCMTDMSGVVLHGLRPRTSELLLHIAIYEATFARAVIHCHPPHATAYAIGENPPPSDYLVEKELFIGEIPLAPYETPGTLEFAQSVLPFIRKHNTVLLANHGIVCWANSLAHAEWLVEVADTYCQTLILASQTGASLRPIPKDHKPALNALGERIRAQIISRVATDLAVIKVGDHATAYSLTQSELEGIIRKTVLQMTKMYGSREEHPGIAYSEAQ